MLKCCINYSHIGAHDETTLQANQVTWETLENFQVKGLKKAFDVCPYMTPVMKMSLPRTLNLSFVQVMRWFQTQRQLTPNEMKARQGKH